jgi:phosphatidylglycerol lysyltransferase
MKSFRYEIEPRDLFCISFVANSLNTLLGLGGLTGPAIKTMLLKKRNIELKEMISYNAVLVTSTTTGLSVLAVLALINFRDISPLINQHKWLAGRSGRLCPLSDRLFLSGQSAETV